MKLVKLLALGTLTYLILAMLMKYNLLIYGIIVFFLLIPRLLQKYKIFNKTNLQKQFQNIHSMNGYQFEDYLKHLFKSKEYKVKHTPLSGDQGADLLVERNGIKTAIQAKRYLKPVGNKAVQEVLAAKHFYNTQDAIVISNQSYTKSAKELARRVGVSLWSERELKRMLIKKIRN